MTESPTMEAPPGREHALDSLRGIAALLVVVHHLCLTFLPSDGSFLSTAVHALGRNCVLLFFVLSGFALTCALRGRQTYWQYAVRRVCRIYLPFAISIGLAVALYFLVKPGPVPGLTGWFDRGSWAQPVTLPLVARHLAMTGKIDDIVLNNPMWSLVYEMRISLVFPLVLLCVKFLPRGLTLAGIVVYPLLIAWHYYSWRYQPFMAHSYRESVVFTSYFICFFVAGALVAQHAALVSRTLRRWGLWPTVILSLVAFASLCCNVDVLTAFGAVLLICFAITHERFKLFLLWRPFEALGKVSYSLYLTHVLIILTAFHTFYGRVDSVLLTGLTIVASLLAAYGFYYAVELPSLNLGRRLAGKKKQHVYAGQQPER